MKTSQEKQSTKLEIIETNTISLKDKLEEIEQLIQDNHSMVIENIDFNQRELYEIHAQTSQLMEDIRSQKMLKTNTVMN
jgi:chromatin segregation and condensation protein Rec8/ScpA/Scc1 (kleisin family)